MLYYVLLRVQGVRMRTIRCVECSPQRNSWRFETKYDPICFCMPGSPSNNFATEYYFSLLYIHWKFPQCCSCCVWVCLWIAIRPHSLHAITYTILLAKLWFKLMYNWWKWVEQFDEHYVCQILLVSWATRTNETWTKVWALLYSEEKEEVEQ